MRFEGFTLKERQLIAMSNTELNLPKMQSFDYNTTIHAELTRVKSWMGVTISVIVVNKLIEEEHISVNFTSYFDKV